MAFTFIIKKTVVPPPPEPESATFYVIAVEDDGYVNTNADFFTNSVTSMWISSNTTSRQLTSFIRFPGVTVPQGATITEAYLRWRWNNTRTSPVMSCPFYVEDVDSAAVITSRPDMSSRDKIYMYNLSTNSYDETYYNTPSIITGVQQVINRPGWSSGNAMQFFLGPYGVVGQWAIYQSQAGYPAELHLTWVA